MEVLLLFRMVGEDTGIYYIREIKRFGKKNLRSLRKYLKFAKLTRACSPYGYTNTKGCLHAGEMLKLSKLPEGDTVQPVHLSANPVVNCHSCWSGLPVMLLCLSSCKEPLMSNSVTNPKKLID